MSRLESFGPHVPGPARRCMGMASKLVLSIALGAALVAAGCGSQSHPQAAASRADASQATTSQSEAQAGETAQADNASPTRKSARPHNGLHWHNTPLGPHTSRAPEQASDYEGPVKPNTSHFLPPKTYRLLLTTKTRGHTTGAASTVGAVTLIPKTRQVCWRFGAIPKVVVHTAAFGSVRMPLRPQTAAIRQGAKGAKGPVVVPLNARYAPRGCTVVAPVALNSILAAPHFYYVTVGGATSPAVLRAQL